MHDTMQRKSLQAAGVVTRSPDGEDGEQEYIKVPISSTAVDRDGDEFSREGLEDLRDQIKSQSRPVFENHGRKEGGGGMFGGLRYDWKDIIGSLDDAEIEESDADTPDVLNGYIRPNPENERGEQLTRYVKEDMPVGFSIGFGVASKDEKDAGGYIFHETDLMEVSSVGIQSNRESVATNAADTAVAMAKRAGSIDADLDEATLARAMVDELLGTRDGEADSDPVRRVQKTNGAGDGAAPDMTEDNDTDDELLERIVSLQEDAAEERQALKDRLDALAKEDDGDDDDDDDDDDDESGEDDDDDGEDGKSADVDLSGLKGEIEEIRSALDSVEAEDSETKSHLSGDEGEATEDTTNKEFEL